MNSMLFTKDPFTMVDTMNLLVYSKFFQWSQKILIYICIVESQCYPNFNMNSRFMMTEISANDKKIWESEMMINLLLYLKLNF